jgi:hypothetical protein
MAGQGASAAEQQPTQEGAHATVYAKAPDRQTPQTRKASFWNASSEGKRPLRGETDDDVRALRVSSCKGEGLFLFLLVTMSLINVNPRFSVCYQGSDP